MSRKIHGDRIRLGTRPRTRTPGGFGKNPNNDWRSFENIDEHNDDVSSDKTPLRFIGRPIADSSETVTALVEEFGRKNIISASGQLALTYTQREAFENVDDADSHLNTILTALAKENPTDLQIEWTEWRTTKQSNNRWAALFLPSGQTKARINRESDAVHSSDVPIELQYQHHPIIFAEAPTLPNVEDIAHSAVSLLGEGFVLLPPQILTVDQ